jgi:hypothetical protein
MTTMLKQFEQAKLFMQNLSKLHGVLRIKHQNPKNATKKKERM